MMQLLLGPFLTPALSLRMITTAMIMGLVVLLSPINMANAASLRSLVSQNEISLNETIQLVVELDQQADTLALDIKLLEPNFDVLGISPQNNSSVTVINGQTTQKVSTTWVITLAPKREGLLTIPAFNIAGAQSSPITVTVKRDHAANKQASSPLSASALVSKRQVYPGEQVLLTVMLSASSDVSNLNASSLEIQNADYELLNQESFSKVNNGIARQIVELKYTVFAKDAGTLKIPSLTFTGIQGSSRSFFGQRGKQVVARTKPFDVTVLEKPDSVNAWFPAAHVEIQATWSGDTSLLTVGTPITRTVTIKAQGQRAEAIPPIRVTSGTNSNYSRYEDQPQLSTEKTAEGLLGIRVESEAIVPSTPGNFTLPAVIIDWFNTELKEWQQATLPAQTLVVVADAVQLPSEHQAQQVSPYPSSQYQNITNQPSPPLYNRVWLWQIVSLFLLLLCLYQRFFLTSKEKHSNDIRTRAQTTLNEVSAWKQLKSDFNSGNTANVRRSLLIWSGEAFQDKTRLTLDKVAEKIADETGKSDICRALENLQAHLYREPENLISEQLKDLEDILTSYRSSHKKNLLKDAKKKAKENDLKPLYPHT